MSEHMVVETEVTVLSDSQIRLKFHGLPGDTGPDLIMDYSMARLIVSKLSSVLPEFDNTTLPVTKRIITMTLGCTITKEDAAAIIAAVNQATHPSSIT